MSIYQQIWKTQQWPQDWTRSVFISVPKKGNAKECSNHRTIALISNASKAMLKILQARPQQYVMFKLVLEKAEEPEIKLPKSVGSQKRQENSRKASTSASLTMLQPLTVWIRTNWKILKEMGIPYYLTYLLRNMHASQEVTVRTRRGTMNWFQIGKGVCQGCILSPCLLTYMLLLLLLPLSCFSLVQLCATPQMAAHQAPPALEFSRQEYPQYII